MKKVFILMAALIAINANAQVGIGVQTPAGAFNPDSLAPEKPQGLLHLQGQQYVNDSTLRNVGFVLPKVDNVTTVKTPDGGEAVAGTIVFTVPDTFAVAPSPSDLSIPGCLRVKTNDGWSDCLSEMNDLSNFFNADIYGGLNVRVKKVSAGYQYSLVIGYEDEAVYAGGSNANGKTGLGSSSGSTATFGMVLASRAIDISAGYQHALAATRNGEVWAWGSGTGYKTGQTTTTNFTFPMRVKNIPLTAGDTIVRCEAGYYNSVLLSKNGKVYVFGFNVSGVNGNAINSTSSTPSSISTPTQLNIGSSGDIIKDIAVSSLSGAALTTDGKVYTWGDQAYGRLGNGNVATTSSYVIPGPINMPNGDAVKQVAMGTNHGLAVSADGKRLYGWGAAQGWGGSVATTAAVQGSPVDVTSFLISGGFDRANETIVYAACSRFVATGAPASSGYQAGSIVVTDKNVYACGIAGGTGYSADRWGLGYFKGTTTTFFSPNSAAGTRGTIARGFYPIYDKAIYPGTLFDQASIGVDHSLLKQTLVITSSGGGETTESGSYGYGMGNVSVNQLGAVSTGFSTFPIPSLIKK